MNYYLGVDIGTTSAKAVAFSETGEVMTTFSAGYEMNHPQPDQSEQDPDEILSAVILGINTVIQTLAPRLPVFLSFSAAMHSFIAVDEKGRPLTPCIIWADNRANAIADQLRQSKEGQHIYATSGVPIHSMSPLCKLLWFRQNQPGIFNSAFKFIGIKEYIFYKLFTDFVVDTSIASATGLLNIKTLQWDDALLNLACITSSRLSRVVSTKQIFYYRQPDSGLSLSSDIPVVIGSSDGALSNLGTGATGQHAIAVTIGTSGAVRRVISSPETDKQMRTFCYHLKDDQYIIGGANNNGAIILQWLKESLLQTNEDYDELFEQAKTIPAGSEGLLFLPYLLGERAPLWNSNARGVFFGLTIQHTKAHFIRACLEAVVYSMHSIAKILAEKNVATELHASGGFAKSALWLQILADVTNIKVHVSGAVESSALGAVMLGAEAVGITTGFESRILATYLPDEVKYEIYKKRFEKFERLYELLKGEMVNETRL